MGRGLDVDAEDGVGARGLLVELGLGHHARLLALLHVADHLLPCLHIALLQAVDVDSSCDAFPDLQRLVARVDQVVQRLVVDLQAERTGLTSRYETEIWYSRSESRVMWSNT